MRKVRQSAPQLQGLVPYDPKYLPAEAFLSANENPSDVDQAIRAEIMEGIAQIPFNRYPDPLANGLRDLIAEANGLSRENVLLGNGGDELLFSLALAWGGPGRTFLNVPPTFSVYAANARLTGTTVVDVPRRSDFTIDQEAVLSRAAQGDIDFVVITSPNNPTADCADEEFLLKLLDATDALVMVDEAYCEFSKKTMLPHLRDHQNLLLLRTFSKAYSLAGVRMGYILANEHVINEFVKVRQPYSVDAVSQVIARTVFMHREELQPGIDRIIEERARVSSELSAIAGVEVFPTEANFIMFRMPRAGELWGYLYERGVLIRDFSKAPLLENCMRVTVGTPDQNDAFLNGVRDFVAESQR